MLKTNTVVPTNASGRPGRSEEGVNCSEYPTQFTKEDTRIQFKVCVPWFLKQLNRLLICFLKILKLDTSQKTYAPKTCTLHVGAIEQMVVVRKTEITLASI